MNTPSTAEIGIDHATQYKPIPDGAQLRTWASTVLSAHRVNAGVDIRLVESEESAFLNERYRNKKGATNILSFKFEVPTGVKSSFLGDIILCPMKIAEEMTTQTTSTNALEAHRAHLVIHGCLHLLDYHHDQDSAAHKMEQLEIEYLTALGYSDPYE